MTIGVAISTHARPGLLARTLPNWAAHLGGVATLAVIHDEAGDGVAATKNRCLAALMDAGCTELFLADDDVWPLADRWWQPYTTYTEPHLMHCWGKTRFITYERDVSVWSWPRGCLLYVTRPVVEKVGGMRTEFGRWGGEHAEWSQRIHNAGFTSTPFCDAITAKKGIWYCTDYTREVPSSVPSSVRDSEHNTRHRHQLYKQFKGSTHFVAFN